MHGLLDCNVTHGRLRPIWLQYNYYTKYQYSIVFYAEAHGFDDSAL